MNTVTKIITQNNFIQTNKLLSNMGLFFILCFGINSVSANVIDISATAFGDGIINSQTFFDKDDPGAHFSLDTLDVNEEFNNTNSIRSAWLDLNITITRDIADTGDQMIAIDKDVTNNTNFPWHLFNMSVGTGIGIDFVATPGDGISFKDTPPPVDLTDKFKLLRSDTDNLWFKTIRGDDLLPGGVVDFWIGINISEDNFIDGVANITLRQHAEVSEPSIFMLMGFSLLLAARVKRYKS